jgi:nitric oxide reductase subunit B
MVVLDLFPGGVLQLWDVLSNGYWHARRLDFLTSGTFHLLEWARIGADMVFLVIGVVPIVVAALRITLSPASAEARPTIGSGDRATAAA